MSKRDYDANVWIETCSECGQDFIDDAGENPYVALLQHFHAAHPEQTILCPRRASLPPVHGLGDRDFWKIKPNGDRTCSFCGGMHPDDFMKCVDAAIDPNSPCWIEQSDKQYKVYIHRPDVKNATEGGIKFYKYHVTATGDELNAQAEKFARALEASRPKFQRILDGVRLHHERN